MPRGGSRVGAGRPKKGTHKPKAIIPYGLPAIETGLDAAMFAPQTEASEPQVKGELLPLEYMLAVMNDPGIDAMRRDRMAVAAAPFLHPKQGEGGKKEQKTAAAKAAGGGKFAPSAPPKLAIVTK